jgi:tetratricopeptide (TPR) repeat protein
VPDLASSTIASIDLPLSSSSSTSSSNPTSAPSSTPTNPTTVEDFWRRANQKLDNGDYQAAIEDYNRVIELNPNLALAYYNRGLVRTKLSDRQGAIADFQRAADLYQQQGQTQQHQDAIDHIQQLQQ